VTDFEGLRQGFTVHTSEVEPPRLLCSPHSLETMPEINALVVVHDLARSFFVDQRADVG